MDTDRYFLATILGGHLYPNGIPEGDLWESSRLHWCLEDELDLILRTTGDRKVQTAEELHAVMKEPIRGGPTKTVWIHESLEDEARRLWEEDDSLAHH